MDHDETRRLVAEEKRRRRLIDTFNKNARRTDYPDTAPPEWDAVFEGFSGTSENQLLHELTAQASVEQGLVAVNTNVFDHWMGIFSQAEMSAFLAEYQFAGATVSDEKQAEMMEDGPPEKEGPWVVIGRPGEKVTQADVIATFVGLREKYPGDRFFQPGRSYCFEGVARANTPSGAEYASSTLLTHLSLPMPSARPGGREHMVNVPRERCFELVWGS